MTRDEIERCYNYYVSKGGNGGKYNIPPAVIKSLINQYVNPYSFSIDGEITLYNRAGQFIKRINTN